MMHQESDIFSSASIDEASKAYLLETVRWTRFLAIIGFISMGLLVLFTFLMAIAVNTLSSPTYPFGILGTTLYMLVMVGLYIYPALALIRFSSFMKRGLTLNDQDQIREAFRHQKNLYKYLGILVIVALVLCLSSVILAFLLVAVFSR
jgi:uncharacterized membrane protein